MYFEFLSIFMQIWDFVKLFDECRKFIIRSKLSKDLLRIKFKRIKDKLDLKKHKK